MKGKTIVEDETRWKVGNCKTIKLWSDWWVKDKPLELENGMSIIDDQQLDIVSNFILPTNDGT